MILEVFKNYIVYISIYLTLVINMLLKYLLYIHTGCLESAGIP